MLLLRHHSTSGASDTIFAKFFSRSSRPTGPKILVPRGFSCRSIRHGGVLVEADVGAVFAAVGLLDPHDHGAHHVALLDVAARGGLFDRPHDDVAHPCVPPLSIRP